MGSGISLPSLILTKRRRLNTEQYQNMDEAPGIRNRRTFGWSQNEIPKGYYRGKATPELRSPRVIDR